MIPFVYWLNKIFIDTRNLLFESYIRVVKELKPKCFVFENVKGIKTMFSGKYLENVINGFTSLEQAYYSGEIQENDFKTSSLSFNSYP